MKLKRIFSSAFLLIVVAGIAFYFSAFQQQPQGESVSVKLHSTYGVNPAATFDPVLPDSSVTFPQDFAFHPGFQNETWHYSAHLTDTKNNRYSVHWNYQRVSRDEDISGGWKSSQLYIAQIIVSSDKGVWHQQRLARGGLGQAGLRTRPFRLWIDNWLWRSASASPLPGILDVATDSFSLSLKSLAQSPYIPEGVSGYVEQHNLLPVASYGFQVPFIRVIGNLLLDGKLIAVEGRATLDKEWHSDSAIMQVQKQAEFVVNLDDGRLVSIQHNQIKSLPSYTFGSVTDRKGNRTLLQDSDIEITPLQMSQLYNGKSLPLNWVVSIPKLDVKFTVSALKKEMWHAFIEPYWQGPVAVLGNSKGSGSLRLSGY